MCFPIHPTILFRRFKQKQKKQSPKTKKRSPEKSYYMYQHPQKTHTKKNAGFLRMDGIEDDSFMDSFDRSDNNFEAYSSKKV